MQSQVCLPRTAAIVGIEGDTTWPAGIVRRDIESMRLYNQLTSIPDTWLRKQIYKWDRSLMYENSWSETFV